MKWSCILFLFLMASCGQPASNAEDNSAEEEVQQVVSEAAPVEADSVQVQNLLNRYACASCHGMESKPVGPGWPEIAARNLTLGQFKTLIANPEPANWPDYTPMAPMGYVPDGDLEKIYAWMTTLTINE
ncbi:c-type cytochrome [Fulvivirga sedimenti]|uniref:Cytochrome c domain-containing protein n=1 Tax=Fulvivirga sedimenti TaxID=2879465 RepID=A0A9X1L0Y8_9BACT|nr:cytochrome c [Fulvivirga sedimenti]MCA6078349.1 hypothetical protein [Fulvivirga sedimenti]